MDVMALQLKMRMRQVEIQFKQPKIEISFGLII